MKQVTGNEWVKLTSYKLKDVDHLLYSHLMKNRGTYTTPITWVSFCETFLYRFYPLEFIETKVHEFINLSQGNMTD